MVMHLALHPPPGYETAGVIGPRALKPFFKGVPFEALEGLRPWSGFAPDLVHAHGFTAAAHAVASERLGRLAGFGEFSRRTGQAALPVVVTVHTAPAQTLRAGATGSRLRPVQRALWRGGRLFAERADALIAPSQEVAQGLKGAVVIPPAIDLPVAAEKRSRVREILGTSSERVVVLAVARLHPDKALDAFIEAVAGTDAEGWIAGEGPERANLEQLAAGTRVRLLGERADVGSLLGAADLFALPAAGEAYGFAVMEALAAGLPVVATRTGAIPEIAGDAALLVDPLNRQGFIEATRRLILDADARRRLAERARLRPLPSASDLVRQVGQIYDKVCRNFRGRGGPDNEKMT